MDYQQPQQPQQPEQQPQQPQQQAPGTYPPPQQPQQPQYAPPPPQYTQQPGYPIAPPPQGGGSKGMSITSMCLGIASIVFAWWSFFAIIGLLMGIAALILAVMARKKNPSDGFALAGMICGIIGVVLSTIIFFACGVCICAASPYYYYW